MSKKIMKDVAKTAARSAYKAKTAPLQMASMVASKLAPGSKVAKGLKKAATPFKKGGYAKLKDGSGEKGVKKMKDGGMASCGGRAYRQARQRSV